LGKLCQRSRVCRTKKYIQAIIQDDIEKFSTQSSHVSTPWLSGNIAKKVFGTHFDLNLKNKPE
jgi:hypothetical protein